MLLIRPAVRTDVHLLKTLIHEMGEHERLPVLIPRRLLRTMDLGHGRNSVFSLRTGTVNPRVTLSSSIAIPRFGDAGYS
jgi:hypothetical protein